MYIRVFILTRLLLCTVIIILENMKIIAKIGLVLVDNQNVCLKFVLPLNICGINIIYHCISFFCNHKR